MKKKAKKLTLAKETVRNLAEPALGKVVGGSTNCTNDITWLCVTTNGPRECAFACIEP